MCGPKIVMIPENFAVCRNFLPKKFGGFGK